MKAAVTLIIFNRPDTTRLVFDAIAKAKPKKLLVIADGPRPDRPGEAERCAAARAIIGTVDWDCEILTNFSDINLGCRRRVASGLDWVFSQVEDSIILEDDCLPHPDFFSFCDALLDRYREDGRVMAIGGANLTADRHWGGGSYYFSRYCHIWGWASWRRAWRHYDVEMAALPDFLERQHEHFPAPAEAQYWSDLFRATRDGLIDTWDYQWQFTILRQQGLTIVPNANLVSNIGFGPDATHTKDTGGRGAVVPVHALGALRHPSEIAYNRLADQHFFRLVHHRSFARRARDKLVRRWRAFNRWRDRVQLSGGGRSADSGRIS
ncbi:MAG TPA: hypothetical protein VNT30_10060 [Stellaceae bacterium]|nr:hypothetical protein [Stellaceae bacterium]